MPQNLLLSRFYWELQLETKTQQKLGTLSSLFAISTTLFFFYFRIATNVVEDPKEVYVKP